MIYIKFISFLLITTMTSWSANASTFFPEPLLFMDNYFSHHVLIAEKSTHKLYLYENNSSYPKLVKVFKMATGKKAGNKFFQGDYRTPEGVYFFTDFLTQKTLIERHGKAGEIYGVGAFVLNYPNAVDTQNKKTGGGIWLHSTNDETRIDKGLDSRGCLVAANKHLIEIAKFIELNKTTIIVVHDLNFLNEQTWEKRRELATSRVYKWISDWENENTEEYMNSYHKDFKDDRRGSWNMYRNYKKSVFAGAGKPKIKISHLSLQMTKDYLVATFMQDYQSATISDRGRKTLYLKRDKSYQWKIVAEVWSKNGISENKEQVAFTPSMRFFNTNDPYQILGDKLLQSSN